MLVILSPSKKQEHNQRNILSAKQPYFQDEIKYLVKMVAKLSPKEISSMMDLSEDLSNLTFNRYKSFQEQFNDNECTIAIQAFKGDVYNSICPENYSASQLEFLDQHFIILSGLYGALHPSTLIQPYRLEMGTKLATNKGDNLYHYWDDKITKYINDYCLKYNHKEIINLASKEYWQAIDPKQLNAKIITITFKEFRNGKYKVIALNAKRARSLMSDYIISNNVDNIEQLKKFNSGNYIFKAELSDEQNLLFVRE
jgi:uncharacterized protein